MSQVFVVWSNSAEKKYFCHLTQSFETYSLLEMAHLIYTNLGTCSPPSPILQTENLDAVQPRLDAVRPDRLPGVPAARHHNLPLLLGQAAVMGPAGSRQVGQSSPRAEYIFAKSCIAKINKWKWLYRPTAKAMANSARHGGYGVHNVNGVNDRYGVHHGYGRFECDPTRKRGPRKPAK